jgi:hypothetical protein
MSGPRVMWAWPTSRILSGNLTQLAATATMQLCKRGKLNLESRGAKLLFGVSEAEDRARFEVAASNPTGGSANYQLCFQIVVGSSPAFQF